MSILYLQTGTYAPNGTGGGNSSFLPGGSGMTAFSGAYVPPPSPPPPVSGGDLKFNNTVNSMYLMLISVGGM